MNRKSLVNRWWRQKTSLGQMALVTAFFIFLFLIIFFPLSKFETKNISKNIFKSAKVFPTVTLEARGAVVYDLDNNKVLFGKNEQEVLPLASISKLMTAMIAHEKLPADAKIVLNMGTTSETWYETDLSDYVLVESFNQGATALARAVEKETGLNFIKQMNNRGEQLGLQKMHFNTASGLDLSDSEAGAYGSAIEVAKLHTFIHRQYPEILSATKEKIITRQTIDDQPRMIYNTNEAINLYPNLISSKTGFTNLAGGNLTIIFEPQPNRPIAIVVLGSSIEGRFSDTKILVDATISHLAD